MTASLSDCTDGEITQFKLTWAQVGMTPDIVRLLNCRPDIAKAMMKTPALQEALGLVQGLFLPADKQVEALKIISNDSGWGFEPKDFVQAARTAPKWPDKWLTAVVLVPYMDTGTMMRVTFGRLVAAIGARHDFRSEFPVDEVRPYNQRVVPVRGLRWETIELGCRTNAVPHTVRSMDNPSAGVLAAALLHPAWTSAIDGKRIPFVWVPGFEALETEKSSQWTGMPKLWRDGRGLTLSSDYAHGGGERVTTGFAVPRFYRE